LAVGDGGRRTAGPELSRLPRLTSSTAADTPLPSRLETSVGRHLAGDGRAGDARHQRYAARHSPHLPRPQLRRQGAGRPAKDDARSMPWRCCTARCYRGSADGRRRDETCLAAMQATGHPAWAALSTSGLRALDLPEDVRDVIVLADGDDPGKAAARDCAWRWKREGRRVRIARPHQGMDFNDMLVRHAPRVEDGVR